MGKKGKARRAQRRKQRENKEMKKMNNPSNFKTTTTTTWKAPAPPCHSGQNKVFTTTGGIDVYAGGRNRSGGWWMCNAPLDLAIGPDETMRPTYGKTLDGSTVVPKGWSCDQFVGRTDPPKYMIEMDFPDFGVPQVEDYFWYALHDDIVEHGVKSISTQCAGGHGRTGVQLAILYYLLNDDDVKATIKDAAQLIELVRELHCDHAVETNEQQQYIARVLDIPAGESVVVERYSGWSGYSWGSDKGKAVTTTGATSPKTTMATDGYDLSEKYVMADTQKALAVEECECCGEIDYSLDEDRCYSCGWELPDNKDTMLCMTCGNDKPMWTYTSPADQDCIPCHARSQNIRFTALSVECSECKKLKAYDMVNEFIAGQGFVCLACESNTQGSVKQ
jgi:hypothetical protein